MTAESDGPLGSPLRVAVAGGGVSGLVAARELALAGCEVTLFESGDRLGGRIRGADLCGVSFDIGAESFATRGGSVRELLGELGMDGEITAPSGAGAWVVTPDRAAPLPRSGTLGIPAAPLSGASFRALGVSGALRAAVEPLLPRGFGAAGSGPRPASAPTLASVVRARLGRRTLDRLVRPVALGVHSADPERIAFDALPGLADAFARTGSLVTAARELRGSARAAGGAVAGLRGGMTALVDALAADLARLGVRVELGTSLLRLREARRETGENGAEGSVDLVVRSSGDACETRTLRFGGAVLALPEPAARGALGEAGGSDETGALERDGGNLVEIVAIVIDDERLDAAPRGTGALVPQAGGPIVAKALTHVTAKWAARASDFGRGRHLLRLSYGRAGTAPETLELDDGAVRRLALADASRILGIDLAESSLRGAARRTWAMGDAQGSRRRAAGGAGPDPAAGHRRWTDLGLPSGVVVAGDWASGAGLASVVPGARAAAAAVLDAIRPDRSAARPDAARPDAARPDSAPDPHPDPRTHTATPQHEGIARS